VSNGNAETEFVARNCQAFLLLGRRGVNVLKCIYSFYILSILDMHGI
jgi:hypothetical protein